MVQLEYLVMKRRGQWWVTVEGGRTGPYQEKGRAVASAVALAQIDKHAGRKARVSVDEPDDGLPVVYETASAP
jgi:hypothetical protein